MKRLRLIFVLLAGAGALLLWYLGRTSFIRETDYWSQDRTTAFHPLGAASAEKLSDKLIGTPSASSTTSGVTTKPSDPPEWPILQTLLARPVQWPDYLGARPRMREVPRLSPESEARLITLYDRTERLGPKRHLVYILAFGGDSASARLLWRAVTEEYAGRRVPAEEDALLGYIPTLCGILARRNDEALAHLLEGSRPDFWEKQRLWLPEKADGWEEHPGALTGACIKGLALSGRPEFQEVLDWYRRHPEKLVSMNHRGEVRGVGSSIIDAGFYRSLVREMGIEAAMDKVLYDGETLVRRFVAWEGTPEGKAWSGEWHRLENIAKSKVAAKLHDHK
jgi:hypothetical protein